MDSIKYKHLWNEINERFDLWFSVESWESQVEFLADQIRNNFKLSAVDIKEIFKTFNKIYRIENKCKFDWNEYQRPTLIAITSNYVKFK